jgi:hypothetical protein
MTEKMFTSVRSYQVQHYKERTSDLTRNQTLSFVPVGTVTAVLYRQAKIKIAMYLPHFMTDFDKTWYMRSLCN